MACRIILISRSFLNFMATSSVSPITSTLIDQMASGNCLINERFRFSMTFMYVVPTSKMVSGIYLITKRSTINQISSGISLIRKTCLQLMSFLYIVPASKMACDIYLFTKRTQRFMAFLYVMPNSRVASGIYMITKRFLQFMASGIYLITTGPLKFTVFLYVFTTDCVMRYIICKCANFMKGKYLIVITVSLQKG